MSGKRLLKNVLAHTGSQNKMQEEREMWRLRALEKSYRWEDCSSYESRSMLTRGRLLSDTLVSSPPSHDRHRDVSPEDHAPREERKREGYWTRLLLKQEEKDPSRWGHSGYKEIYAEEFASSESENNEKTKKKKHKDRHGDTDKKKKMKSEALGSDGTHRRKRRRRRESSESEHSSDEDRRKKMKRKKRRDTRKKEKRKRGHHKQRSPSTSDTD